MDATDWKMEERIQAVEPTEKGLGQPVIPEALGGLPSAVSTCIQEHRTDGQAEGPSRQKELQKLTPSQQLLVQDILRRGPKIFGIESDAWSHERIAFVLKQIFNVDYNATEIGVLLNDIGWRKTPLVSQNSEPPTPYIDAQHLKLYQGDALIILSQLPSESVDCIITSPPYYGQRDYEVNGQIGLEEHPQQFILNLVEIFRMAKRVLKPSGSLWVNIGDTYWSGKGQSKSADLKQRHRRFKRPQDYIGEKPWCVSKQQLLIPHRFAILMQQDGWIVRGDNVWDKVNPTPDPTKDRCASSHEYMFHFVQQDSYYFDMDKVMVPCKSSDEQKHPSSVWRIPIRPSFKKHIAVFPDELVHLPIKATCPPGGTILDPFCGSGTVLSVALSLVANVTAVGIDISEESLKEANMLLAQPKLGLEDKN